MVANCENDWGATITACKADLGTNYVPWTRNATNTAEIIKFCASAKCMAYADEWNREIKLNCTPGAGYAMSLPNAIWSPTFCEETPGTAQFDAACNLEWANAFNACTKDAGTIPAGGNKTVSVQITKVCMTLTCQEFAQVWRNQIDRKCQYALQAQAKEPEGIVSSKYCSAAPDTVQPPTTLEAATSKPAPSTQEVIVTTSPAPVPQSFGGSNLTILLGISAALVVVVTTIVLVALLRRRSAQDTGEVPAEKDTVPFHGAFTPRVDPSTADDMWGGMTIKMVRIPYDKIQIGEVVSQGGFGEVSHGFYNGQHVAIKRLLAARRKDRDNVKNFFDEIKLTSSLEHACIVKFIGVAWDSPSNLCMVTQFMAGGDLRSLLSSYAKRNAPTGYDYEKLRIAVQVAHAFTYLHSLQPVVVHRDLKSRNILLTEEHDAKLTDFGISTEQRDLTMTAGVGTSLWMAPEVMMGERFDEKADIFSFGVVLSELDTHELPYSFARDAASSSGRNMSDLVVMQNVAQGLLIPRFSDAADPDIVALGRDCLLIDPKKRPTISTVLYRLHIATNRGSLV